MRDTSSPIFLALQCGLLLSTAIGHAQPAGERVGYYDDIKPILAVHCYKCHDADTQKNGLRLDTLDAARKGGDSGQPAFLPGQSARSELIRRVTSRDSSEMMPPKGHRLTAAEVALLTQWIDQGAPWPERDDYWAFQPPVSSAVPSGDASHPIDRFIDARLRKANVQPGAPADARTLLRRVFFDLLGVPPSLEEAAYFLEDPSPQAYEKLVDRALSDPRYGERWARHWLDLARYGESDGYEDDKVRPHAWRYRDYVVGSLNADKPYNQFVEEQIAGDELRPEQAEAWIATGFARLGAWDGMSKEPAQQRQDFLNDVTDAIGAAFLGLTLGCARCHDHKYDVITQRDYYRVQSFFAGVKRDIRAMPALDEPAFVTAAFTSESAELQRLKDERAALLHSAREALKSEGPSQDKKVDEAAVAKQVNKEHPGRLTKLNEAIKGLESRTSLHARRVEAVFQGSASRTKTYLLKGGELARPGEEITPGFIAALSAPGGAAESAPSRIAFAHWLTTTNHPLTARVLVNRLWQHHFGAGLVDTPSDFGRNGKRPTHLELLDWLATEFVRTGWSMKKMHRLIMTTEAYRRSSGPRAQSSARDPENRLLWRMNRRRVEGEVIRDTILSVSGTLANTMGGPGVYAPLPQGVNVEFPNNDKELSWGVASGANNVRRSIYLFQRRSLTYPLMDVFDAAPMNQSCAARARTTVAPQALALFNGEFARASARQFALRLQREAGDDPGSQVSLAFRLAFTRSPTQDEQARAVKFLQEQAKEHPAGATAAFIDFCHVLLNANELVYPD